MNTMRARGLVFVGLLCGMAAKCPGEAGSTPGPQIEFLAGDRVLVLAPHPDDEVIACGGIIQRALAMQLPVEVVFYTYGDNNQWSFVLYRKHPVVQPRAVQAMGEVRHGEALLADAELGLAPDQLTFLGYPDFGTLRIWQRHWAYAAPFRSMLTAVTAVPYANAFRPGAPYKGEEIVKDLVSILRDFRPTRVFVSHPGDQNPDHRSLYLFTRVALWDLESEMQPTLTPYLVHHAKWPLPRGYHPDVPLASPPAFLDRCNWQINALTPEQVGAKERAIRQHASQFAYAADYLQSFIRPNELFGDFPVIHLRSAANTKDLELDSAGEGDVVPDQLTEDERAKFVGIQSRSIRISGDALVITLQFSRPIARTVEVDVHAFGYRPDVDFKDMPKIQVKIGAVGHRVLDQGMPLPSNAVQESRNDRGITIQIPLALLGNPDKILTDARSYVGEVPLGSVAWRIIDFYESPVEGAGDAR